MTLPLTGILQEYLDLRWQMNPVAASMAGLRQFDGMLARYDPAALRDHVTALKSCSLSLEEADAPTLQDEIDRTAGLHAIRHDLLMLEQERSFARNPARHLEHALTGLWVLVARQREPAERAGALIARLRALPAFLRVAAEVLTSPCAVLTEMALAMVPGALLLVREGIEKAEVDAGGIAPEEWITARTAAVDALTEYRDWLQLAAERAQPGFAIGRDIFDLKLHTAHMIRENADELYRFGELLQSTTVDAIARVANEISPGSHWRDVATRLREDAPASDAIVAEYRDAMRSARKFVVDRALVKVPPGDLHVTPTPDFLRSLIPIAAYIGPGAYDLEQTGTFFVTTPQAWEVRRLHGRAELAITALHEGVPGHHLQFLTANRLSRPVRRILCTPLAQEGWALYCESLMTEQGFLTSPEERFFQLYHLLWRALRVKLDVSLHTRDMAVGEAATMLQEELALDAGSAWAEARRYCAYPTYQLCYATGRRDILRLRDDARTQKGAAFSLAEFHHELLSYGAFPTELARWGMGLS
ncbi:MAG: DUF885 domain-containing protein [Gemmatimonadaceae bacterium]